MEESMTETAADAFAALDPLQYVATARDLLQDANEVDAIAERVASDKEQVRLYKRQEKDAAQASLSANEIQVRAHREYGRILAAKEKSKGGGYHRSTRGAVKTDFAQTQEEMGLSDGSADRAQKLAALDDDTFEQAIADTKAKGKEPTVETILKAAGKTMADLPTPEKTPAERAYDGMSRWTAGIEKSTPEEFAALATEKYPEQAAAIGYKVAQFRALGEFFTRAADLAQARIDNPIRRLERSNAG
jgi:hypothetical protein